MARTQVIIDACSALNLLATGRSVDLLGALDWSLLVLQAIREMLMALHHKARFAPPKRDPLRDWYQEHLSRG